MSKPATLPDVLRATADAMERQAECAKIADAYFATAFVQLAKRIGTDKLTHHEHQAFLYAVHVADRPASHILGARA